MFINEQMMYIQISNENEIIIAKRKNGQFIAKLRSACGDDGMEIYVREVPPPPKRMTVTKGRLTPITRHLK
jgi:hypothetical protein